MNHTYRPDKKEILITDTLELFELNDTGVFIYERFMKGAPREEISRELAAETQSDPSELEEVVSQFCDHLGQNGVVPYLGGLRRTFSPKVAIVHILKACNSKCVMCDCWRAGREERHSHHALVPFFRELSSLGCKEVMISGGEPLLHPELPEILRTLKELGLLCALNTNGILLGQHPWLFETPPDQLVVSLDGISRESYKAIRGVDALDRIRANLRLFRSRVPNQTIGIRVTITKSVLHELSAILDLVAELDLDIGFSPLDTTSVSFGRGEMNTGRSSNLEQEHLPNSSDISAFLVRESAALLRIDELKVRGLSMWSSEDLKRCLAFYLAAQGGSRSPFSQDPCCFCDASLLLDYDGSIKRSHCTEAI